MAPPRHPASPKTYFLNEAHELSAVDKTGGGRPTQYVGISWPQKANKISTSIGRVVDAVRSSKDPLRDERFFVIAQPVTVLRKKSKDKRLAVDGVIEAETSFGGVDGRIFDRLGLDLLQVTEDGQAIVHGDHERMTQLRQRAHDLPALGAREQGRWAPIEDFQIIPLQLRVDPEWLEGLTSAVPTDVVIELQPILRRADADRVLRAIADLLARNRNERLSGTGTDFSGRHWFRGTATERSIRTIASDFYSVQAIHSPLYSVAAATGKVSRSRSVELVREPAEGDPSALPCVAIVDLGVPADHRQLAAYRRGRFVAPDASPSPVGDHGAFVASRAVFGNWENDEELALSSGRCSFYDVMVGDYPTGGPLDRINDKTVMPALTGMRAAAPDVRVFNLSFGDSRPMSELLPVEQEQKRALLQDLDNFAAAHDVIVVVAAGNSPKGLIPSQPYPAHVDDPRWGLGPWACGFNTMVCGSFVSGLSTGGLVSMVGWPSPFTRIGPGLCGAPVPSFGAEGGDSNEAYGFRPGLGLGVWGYSGSGFAEDRQGTSHAAPLLARESALAASALGEACAPDTLPYAVTVRAFLSLTAEKTTTSPQVDTLTGRSLGYGRASSERLVRPVAGSAVILWQGSIETPRDIVRVQIPVPRDWLNEAKEPILRLAVCSDPPVNKDARDLWACRKVSAVLHTGPDTDGIRSSTRAHSTYPLFIREYRLRRYSPNGDKRAGGDLWLLEFSYDEIFGYPPGMDFDPRQRVAFAAELVDRSEKMVDPQIAMQALPSAASMTRLSAAPAAIRSPIILRTRG